MFEVDLQFQHACPYSDLSRRFPDAKLLLWDNFQKEFLDVRSSNREDWPRLNHELERLARKKGSRILRKTTDGKSYQFMIMTCACERENSTVDMIMASDCLFVPPIMIEAGREIYHTISFEKGASRRMLSKFRSKGQAEIANQSEVGTDSLDQATFFPMADPLSGMTRMQLGALTASMELGYYRLPRRTSTGKIAATLQVPRTTFQEHRKKAEAKLMAALAPYILTYGRRHRNRTP